MPSVLVVEDDPMIALKELKPDLVLLDVTRLQRALS